MALTGKTIGQLTYLSEVTTDTLFPVELSGDTYHVAYSAFTNSNYNTGTYDELYSFATGGTLTAGSFYLMTDFQTCYDQPNYDSSGNQITTGNYKVAPTEPILLLAISTTEFSPTVYSTLYPQDKISYDITWNLTEVTGGLAKGRITERIDNFNNRTDYDLRGVKFIRYQGFYSENLYQGKVSLDSNGLVTGVDTLFTNQFTPGDILGVKSNEYSSKISCFSYYEIISITDDLNMEVTGTTIQEAFNVYYSDGISLPSYTNPHQCNIISLNESEEYYTFPFEDDGAYNNYIGNIRYDDDFNEDFILSNNVFLDGAYRDNYFGPNCIGNTFDDDCDQNTIGPNFQFNIITNDFDENVIGTDFIRNIIDCDFNRNSISDGFQYNMIGDSDGDDFTDNVIGNNFQSNFLTMEENFEDNNIGFSFNENIIDGTFENNKIFGDFNGNFIVDSFDNNTVGRSFNNNSVYGSLTDNVIGNSCSNNLFGNLVSSGSMYDNKIGNNFYNNTLYTIFQNNEIGKSFNNNIIYNSFTYNTIGSESNGNTFGDLSDIGGYSFSKNNIGGNFNYNTFSGDTNLNTIGYFCENNNVDTNFLYNKIGNDFRSNTIANDFGFGGGVARGNTIGNSFNNNSIGEYFYDNVIADLFQSNIVGDYFQLNNIPTNTISNIDFTVNYGNIVSVNYSSIGNTATDGTYNGVMGTTSGIGVGATFDITVVGGLVTQVLVNNSGKLYNVSDSIEILGTLIGGISPDDNVLVTVISVSGTPVVYTNTNANIVINSSSFVKLYYLGSSGIEFVDITQTFD